MADDRLSRLREVLKEAYELAENNNLRQEDLDKIRKLWEQQENCLNEAENAGDPTVQEMLVDLKIIDTTGNYLGQHIRQLQANTTTFSPIEYAEKLLAKLSVDGEIDWMQMCDDAVRIINRAPGIPTLLGTFSASNTEIKAVQERKKRSVVRVEKEGPAEKQTPDQIHNFDENPDSVDVKVKHISRILNDCYKQNNREPISFYKFVIHPESFTATVENIFYISFIMRDGLAYLDTRDSDLVIAPLSKNSEQRENSTNKNQMVFSITMDEWQALIEDYGITKPMIR